MKLINIWIYWISDLFDTIVDTIEEPDYSEEPQDKNDQ